MRVLESFQVFTIILDNAYTPLSSHTLHSDLRRGQTLDGRLRKATIDTNIRCIGVQTQLQFIYLTLTAL